MQKGFQPRGGLPFGVLHPGTGVQQEKRIKGTQVYLFRGQCEALSLVDRFLNVGTPDFAVLIVNDDLSFALSGGYARSVDDAVDIAAFADDAGGFIRAGESFFQCGGGLPHLYDFSFADCAVGRNLTDPQHYGVARLVAGSVQCLDRMGPELHAGNQILIMRSHFPDNPFLFRHKFR